MILAFGLGLTQLVATGLAMGVRIGIDGSVQAFLNAIPPVIVGIIAAVFSALLFAARQLWWEPLLARAIATGVVAAAIVLGAVLFDARYYGEFGSHPWFVAIPIEVAVSMGPYAFVGLAVASMLSELLRRRNGVRYHSK
jgi:hypothetical protein